MTTENEGLQKLRVLAAKLMKRPPSEAIDIEFAHPDEQETYVVAYTDWMVHGREMRRLATALIPSAAWGGGEVELERLRELLASAFPAGSDGRPLYVRWHDSAWSLSLRTGETIWDRKRPDRVPPPRRPVREEVFPEPADETDGEVIRRGDAIDLLQTEPKLPVDELCDLWLRRGVRIALEQDRRTVWHITYVPPFRRKICGIWIGASAFQVEQQLGAPADESTGADGSRVWIYEHDGHLSVPFDGEDRVSCICR